MKLTDEQRERISSAMIYADDKNGFYITMLAAGMRELAEVYEDKGVFWMRVDSLRNTADDLEAK